MSAMTRCPIPLKVVVLLLSAGCTQESAGARLERECASIIDKADELEGKRRSMGGETAVAAELIKRHPDVGQEREASWKKAEQKLTQGERLYSLAYWREDFYKKFNAEIRETHQEEWASVWSELWNRADAEYVKNERPSKIAKCVLSRGMKAGGK